METEAKSLFETIREAGIAFDSHESDLYIPDTKEVREILARFTASHAISTRFRNQINGETWIDVPFAFDPWWRKRGL